MAAKPKSTAKSTKNQPESKPKGGARPGAGRKPKAVTEIKQALISELAGTGECPADLKNDAAGYAFRLFDKTMRDEALGLTVRLDCASEVLNRVWGKPMQAVEHTGKGGGPIEHADISKMTDEQLRAIAEGKGAGGT